MSNKVTGNEPVNPFFEYNENGYGQTVTIIFADGSKQFLPYQSGMTIRQKALLEFMCALLVNPNRDGAAEDYAKDADEFVTAYLNQLNKEI